MPAPSQSSHENGSMSFDRPIPRPPKSTAKSTQIRLQNRRREYLERNPDYFNSTEHELAEPLLYDAMIRKLQTPAEREAEGKAKGYSRVLEGDLMRGEARLADLSKTRAQGSMEEPGPPAPQSGLGGLVLGLETDLSPPRTPSEGREIWNKFLTDRFIQGQDDDFDYDLVDENDDYDTIERRDAEDAWFEQEDPTWVTNADGPDSNHQQSKTGETGIQDF